MIIVEKGSIEEWLAWRRAGIGSTDASAIMGVLPWGSPVETALEKTGRITGRVRQPWEWRNMNRGIEMEPEAREAYENWTGHEMSKALVMHEKNQVLRASLDGLNLQAGRALEIKCPGADDHKAALEGRIPQKYFWQCVHILMVTELPFLDYWSYRDGEGVGVVMTRNEFLEKRLLKMELEFWRQVEKDLPPRPDRIFVRSDPMEPSQYVYTEKQIFDLVDGLRERGAQYIEIGGVKATWNLASKPGTKVSKAPVSPKDELGDYVIPIGKKMKGRKLSAVPKSEIEGFCKYLLEATEGDLSDAAKELLDKAELYHFGKISWRKA